MRRILIAIALCLAAAGAAPMLSAAPAADTAKSGIDLAGMDPSVRPQDDFYRYTNGKWLTATEIPADKSGYDSFDTGHEISHGFDDQGSQYDGAGNLLDAPGWFTNEDLARFEAKAHALVAQYAAYAPVPGYPINGELTLGENIADNSGLANAYKAYELSLGGKPSPVIDGLTGEQRLFLGFAQVWRGKTRDAAAIVYIKSDPHSPDQFRGLLPEMNLAPFDAAFDIKPGDKMYRSPEQRVSMW